MMMYKVVQLPFSEYVQETVLGYFTNAETAEIYIKYNMLDDYYYFFDQHKEKIEIKNKYKIYVVDVDILEKA